MKLASETLTVLKNFSTINDSIFINKGKVLQTTSPKDKTILAKAEVKDVFPVDFGIYELNKFLSILTLGKDAPELEFDEHHVIISNLAGRSKLKYRFAAKEMIVTPPDKKITMPPIDIKFTLTQEDFDWIMKTASILQSPNFAVESDGDNPRLTVFDASNDSAHTNSIDLDIESSGSSYKMIFKTQNLKMISGTYDVEISSKGVSHFNNTKDSIQYWIANEFGSKFEQGK
jgi:hypothetical protein